MKRSIAIRERRNGTGIVHSSESSSVPVLSESNAEKLVFQRIEPAEIIPTKKSKRCYLDTHFYDGKLKERIAQHPSLRLKRSYGVVKSMRKAFSRIDSPFLGKIMVDNPGNYDSTNDINALDILCSIYDIYIARPDDRASIEEMLKTQAEEMASGFCSQGRCTRLLQIFFSLCE